MACENVLSAWSSSSIIEQNKTIQNRGLQSYQKFGLETNRWSTYNTCRSMYAENIPSFGCIDDQAPVSFTTAIQNCKSCQ